MSLARLAFRNLQRNRRRTLITLVALIFGTGSMVALRGFMVGMRGSILENQMRGTLGALQVHKRGYVENVLGSPLSMNLADTPELRATLAGVPGVVAVSPRIEFGAQLSTPDKKAPPDDGSELPESDRGTTSFLVVTAFDAALEQRVTPRRWEWVKAAHGHFFEGADGPWLMLNDDFATGLELRVLPEGTPLPPVEQQVAVLAADVDAALNGENVVLVGTLASATPNDRHVGLMPLATAQHLLRMEGRVTEYALAVSPTADLAAVKQAVVAQLGPEYEVHLWSERMPFVNDIVGTQDFVFGVISTIFLLVVLLGIVNAMLMSVLERVREIGTMLAIGLKRRQIVQLFVLEGFAIGVVGALVGAALGMALVLYSNRVGVPLENPGAKVPTVLHPSVEPSYLVRIVVQSVLGAVLASLWPARHASRLKPIEALAHV